MNFYRYTSYVRVALAKIVYQVCCIVNIIHFKTLFMTNIGMFPTKLWQISFLRRNEPFILKCSHWGSIDETNTRQDPLCFMTHIQESNVLPIFKWHLLHHMFQFLFEVCTLYVRDATHKN